MQKKAVLGASMERNRNAKHTKTLKFTQRQSVLMTFTDHNGEKSFGFLNLKPQLHVRTFYQTDKRVARRFLFSGIKSTFERKERWRNAP
jgi:hypothetical protein